MSYARGQVSVGVRGSYVNSNLSIERPSVPALSPGAKALSNWNVGLVFNIPVATGLYLQPVLSYEQKGGALSYPDKSPANAYTIAATKLRLNYLTLPANLVYKIPVGKTKLAIGAGPYVGYCASARYDLSVYNEGREVQTTHQSVDFNSGGLPNTNIQLSRWDFGANAIVSLELNNYTTFSVNYSYGLSDIDKSHELKINNRSFGISFGFILNREDW